MELYFEISVDETSVLHMRIGALHDHVICINCNLAGDLEQLMIMAVTIFFYETINLAKLSALA